MPPQKSADLAARNRVFYDDLWSKTYLTRPERFNTWPLVSELVPQAPMRLEVGPGLRPRLPVAGTHFADLSPPAVERLRARGGLAQSCEISALPYGDATFDLVLACDVIEHVADDLGVFRELTRVLKPAGVLIFSVPLHAAHWTVFDDYVGHARRYEPGPLLELLAGHGLAVERSAVFGMQANSPRVLRFTVRGMIKFPTASIRGYNWFFLPLGFLLQKPLQLAEGLIDLADVHEILLVCRRRAGAEAP
jgi:SAM-dependent methyltransferase